MPYVWGWVRFFSAFSKAPGPELVRRIMAMAGRRSRTLVAGWRWAGAQGGHWQDDEDGPISHQTLHSTLTLASPPLMWTLLQRFSWPPDSLYPPSPVVSPSSAPRLFRPYRTEPGVPHLASSALTLFLPPHWPQKAWWPRPSVGGTEHGQVHTLAALLRKVVETQ